MAITKVYSTWVIGGAAIIAVVLSFCGKLAALIRLFRLVMGGVCLLLFGVIAASGIRILVETKVDYSKSKNLIMTSVPLVVGLSGAKVSVRFPLTQGVNPWLVTVSVMLPTFMEVLDTAIASVALALHSRARSRRQTS